MSTKAPSKHRRSVRRTAGNSRKRHAPVSRWHSSPAKRAMDIGISAVLIVGVLSWLTPLLFLLICMDSRGPLFFVQHRTGRAGRIFSCYKFRTMRPPSATEMPVPENDAQRITSIGALLRTTHIDELPQLLNVLFNQMSLVGPRPHMIRHDLLFSEMLPQYSRRHQVKPGITGMAQAWGYHGAIPDYFSIAVRTRLDLFYIEKASLAMDLRIMCRTLLTRSVNRITKRRRHDQQL
jgi:putative colanic acid biosynthesis UDP-glucose lipid carrier transferase